MPPSVKICGLTRTADVEWAVSCGADAIGIVLAPSPRQVDRGRAQELIRAAGSAVIKVAVFRSTAGADLQQLSDLGFDAVQGEPAVMPATSTPLVFLPVVIDGPRLQSRVTTALAGWRQAGSAAWSRLGNPDLLLDGPRGGGGGVVADINRARVLAVGHRIVLAGGLTPENVARSVAAIGPVAVDVSSGVESAPGLKDHNRVKAFIEAVRTAATTTEAIS